jgi:hypothetical protein
MGGSQPIPVSVPQTGNAGVRANPAPVSPAPQVSTFTPPRSSRATPEEMGRTRGSGWDLASVSHNEGVYFVHPSSVVRSGSVVTSWVLQNLWETERTQNITNHQSILSEYQFECAARRARIGDMQFFAERGAHGRVVHSVTVGWSNWVSIPPGSILENVFQIVCQSAATSRPRNPAPAPAAVSPQPPVQAPSVGPPKDPI